MVVNAVSVLELLTRLIPLLLLAGAGWKFLPVVRNWVNEGVIPVLNALLAFFLAFVGSAHAGILADVGKALSGPAQVFISIVASALAAVIHDKFLKPILPESPYSKGK